MMVDNREYHIFDLNKAATLFGYDLKKMPFSLKILLENLLRFENEETITKNDIKSCLSWLDDKKGGYEISYNPTRVLMQDFTGVPAVVDLAAMRDGVANLGGSPDKINPLSPVDLIIDHSIQVDSYGNPIAHEENIELEIKRNHKRYEFLSWGQKAFDNFRVVPPGTGICHQVNLEYLAKVVWTKNINGKDYAFPDTLVGTDSHTTMINALGVLGWGVGGIEAEAVMLGESVSMLIPDIIGFELKGKIPSGTTATDLVLTITEILRKQGVVGKFVEFYGSGLDNLSLADRATIANMAPEYGATCGFFAIDEETIKYLTLTARSEHEIKLVETYAKRQGLWRDNTIKPEFTVCLSLDLTTVKPSIAGPKRPQDKILLADAKNAFKNILGNKISNNIHNQITNGSIVIAAITSCTNTSNPSVMIAAGLVAKKANLLGIKAKPWVKTSLAPGSQVVSEYLIKSGLQKDLDNIGFNVVGFGCTTCIGNSGPLNGDIENEITTKDLLVVSVLSGNRNFEGRVHPLCKANYLASPPLVVLYALAGNMQIDIYRDAITKDVNGKDVFLKDLWPDASEIEAIIEKVINPKLFAEKYRDIFSGNAAWQAIQSGNKKIYEWEQSSTYIQNPPYFIDINKEIQPITPIKEAKILAKLADSVTTDHISPAGSIAIDSPAARYLKEKNIDIKDFNSYGARRGNHEIMMRGTFANIRIRNELIPGIEGGFTKYLPTGEIMSIYDAAMKYKENNVDLVVLAGKEYGTGSSRDWAAKGVLLLGVKAVIAESFERIHRSNLVRMGIIPLEFKNNMTRNTLNIQGDEKFDIIGVNDKMQPKSNIKCVIKRSNNETEEINLLSRIDTEDELFYFKNGGILQTVIRKMLN